MFTKTPEPTDSALDNEITHVYDTLENLDPESKEYAKALKHLKDLYSLKPEKPETVSPDAVLKTAGALLGIGIIVIYEQKHVLTSKAMSFIKMAL